MKYQFIKNHSGEFPVKKMAEVLQVSKSRYYSWLKEPSEKKIKDQYLEPKILKIFATNRETYGSPRISDALKDEGIICGVNRTARIMKNMGIKASTKKKFIVTTDSNHNYPIAPNIVDRNFAIERPNEVWVSDITYIWTHEGWLYLCVILDLFSRLVVGYSMSSNIDTPLVSAALRMALISRQPNNGLIFHSDRGSQYASHDFRDLLKENGIIQSMSRKGNCWDNACAESFFSTLKKEEVYRRSYKSRKEARISIFEYITTFYNNTRKHSFLDYLSPKSFELKWFRKNA
jgi:transposase InsO family protein